jgi:hypothetical protein
MAILSIAPLRQTQNLESAKDRIICKKSGGERLCWWQGENLLWEWERGGSREGYEGSRMIGSR